MLINERAEEDVLGRLLLNPEHVFEISVMLKPEHFTNQLLSGLYRAIYELMMEGKPIEPALLQDRLKDVPTDVMIPMQIARLKAEVDEPGNLPEYAELVFNCARKRQLKSTLMDLDKRIAQSDTDDLLSEAHAKLLSLQTDVSSVGKRVGIIASEIGLEVRQHKKQGRSMGLVSGLRAFDELVGAMMPEDLIVLGGATSMGKTALGQGVLKRVADQGVPCVFFSLEMSKEQITTRYISQLSGIPYSRIVDRELNAEEEESFTNAEYALHQVPLHIESMSRATVSTILASAMGYKRRHGVMLIGIDHMHYINPDGRPRSETEGFGQIVRDLKAAAKDLKIPIITMAQLNRNVNSRPNKRPVLSDLYAASEIEKSADAAVFVHRPQYWLERDEPDQESSIRADWEVQMDRWKGRSEIILRKRRGGKGIGIRECAFDEELTYFRDIQ